MSQNSNLLTHSPPNKTSPTKNYHPAIMAPITLLGKTWICLPIVCFFNFKDAVSIFILFQSYFSTVKSLLKGCSHEQVILTCTRLQNMPCTCPRHLRIILAPNSQAQQRTWKCCFNTIHKLQILCDTCSLLQS